MNKINTTLINHDGQNNLSYVLKTLVINNSNIMCISAAVLFSLGKFGNSFSRLFTSQHLESIITNSFKANAHWDVGIPKAQAEFLALGNAYSIKPTDNVDVSIKVGKIEKQVQVAASGTLGFDSPYFAGRQPEIADAIDLSQSTLIIPDNIMPEHFNIAPADQRLENLFNGDEAIEIKNMHQLFPVINSSLPGIHLRFFVIQENPDKQDVFREMVVQNDTLWLLPNVECGILIYRATCPIADNVASDIKCVYSVIEELAQEPKSGEYYMQQMLTQANSDGLVSNNNIINTNAAAKKDDINLSQTAVIDSSTNTTDSSPIDEEKIILDVIDKIQNLDSSTLTEAEKQYQPIFAQLKELMKQFKLTDDGMKDFLEDRKKAGLSLYPSEDEIVENFREVWDKDPELEKSLKEKMEELKKIRVTQLEQLRHRIAS